MDKENQELNEKLARWAGFIKMNPTCDCEICKSLIWWSPNKEIFPNKLPMKMELPDFTNDLNAYFKWLVPKLLRDLDGSREITLIEDKDGVWTAIPPDWNCTAKADTPALALCRAIEQVIGSEQRNNNYNCEDFKYGIAEDGR